MILSNSNSDLRGEEILGIKGKRKSEIVRDQLDDAQIVGDERKKNSLTTPAASVNQEISDNKFSHDSNTNTTENHENTPKKFETFDDLVGDMITDVLGGKAEEVTKTVEPDQKPAKKTFLPMTIAPDFKGIPPLLMYYKRWLCWQLQPADPKPRKVPMTPKNGKLVNAAVNKPENWLMFDDAMSYYNRGLCSGIGFALTNAPPKVCCVDVDHCFTNDGILTDEARAVMETCQNSFTEKSQSGTGIHIWFFDDDFHGGRKKGNVEVYAADRYIAMTGVRVQPSAKDLLTVNGACRNVIAKFIGERSETLFKKETARKVDSKEKSDVKITEIEDTQLTDDARKLIKYFSSDKCRSQHLSMFDLWRGDKARYFEGTGNPVDDSVADYHLMLNILCYVGNSGTDSDIGQRALKIFGQSALAKREKWQREDYRIRTLNAAFECWNNTGRHTIDAQNNNSAQICSLKIRLSEIEKEIADFDKEKDAALEKLRDVEKFDSDTVFSEEVITAAAFARLTDRKAFSDFRREVKIYGDKHKDQKVAVNNWLADVRDRAKEIQSRESDLITRRNKIKAQIQSLSFVGEHDLLKEFVIPFEYSISSEFGIEKVEGGKIIPVCRRPVVIVEKIKCVDEQNISKLVLSFQTTTGKWKKLPPTEKAIVFNRNRLIDLANADLPVTSANAYNVVEYLDAFNALNEHKLPLSKFVNRGGWRSFNGTDYFIDPRREVTITDDDSGKIIRVNVDTSRSEFAQHLKHVGSLDKWKEIYQLAKKSPVARLMVAAAVAPPLLKILGERNFLLYVYTSTRAGKTTALYLGTSAVGGAKINRSFDATKNGLAGAAADVNDYCFPVDEKQVADDRIKDQITALVYALANGVGRTKLNRDSTLKEIKDWRTIAIMTGETLLLPDNVTGGANTRLLTVKAPKVILPSDDCQIIREGIKENYGLAFPLVIDKILQTDRKILRGIFDGMTATFKERYSENLPEHRRYMAILTLADALLNSALFGDTLTTSDGESIKPSDDAIINAGKIFPMLPTKAEISDTPREKEFVRSFIGQNQNRFVGGNVDLDKIQMFYGKLKDDDGFTYIAVKALKDACAIEGFDFRKLVADLVADGFFKPDDKIEKGHKTPRTAILVKIGKTNMRCYRIPTEKYDERE